MSKKSLTLLLCMGIVIVLSLVAVFLHRQNASSPATPNITTTTVSSLTPSTTATISTPVICLPSSEYGSIPPSEESNAYYGWPNSSTIEIYVKNKTTGDIVSTFRINNIVYGSGDALEIYPCGVYAIEGFGKLNAQPGYTMQLWRYNYTGAGEKLFTFFVDGPNYTQAVNNYYPDFSVSPDERYLVLEQAPTEASDSIVIDDANTLKNLYTLSLAAIIKKQPNIMGMVEFQPGGWSSNGRYFWFNHYEAADVFGFVRIDSDNWSYQAFVAPATTMAGDAFNPDTGMVTYGTNTAPWTGDSDIDQQYRNEAEQAGQITSFDIYDFLTGQNYLVTTTTDPTYYFQPKWISDTQLRYTLPSGTTTTYTIQQ